MSLTNELPGEKTLPGYDTDSIELLEEAALRIRMAEDNRRANAYVLSEGSVLMELVSFIRNCMLGRCSTGDLPDIRPLSLFLAQEAPNLPQQ